jgi:hypothetical protein
VFRPKSEKNLKEAIFPRKKAPVRIFEINGGVGQQESSMGHKKDKSSNTDADT